MSESSFAQHVVNSIRNELELLKKHDYIQPQAYNDILRLLPNINSNNNTKSTENHGVYSPVNGMPTPSTQSHQASTPIAPPPAYNSAEVKSLFEAEALYDYRGDNPNTDLGFKGGDTIKVIEIVNENWWKGTLCGKTGIFPSNYVKKLDSNTMKSTTPNTPAHQPVPSYSSNYNSPAPVKQDSYNNYPPPLQQQPYSHPPPPTSSYAPPPGQYPYQQSFQQASYGQPLQQTSYGAPPPVAMAQTGMSSSSAPAAVPAAEGHSAMSGFGKKLAGNVANAATWGFGATLGGDLAHKIF